MEFSLRARWALLAKPILVLVCVSLTGALAVEASATSLGVLVDVYSGNDSESAIAANLGVDLGLVTLLANIEDPATSSDGLTIFNRVLKDGEDDEYVSGEWSYSGPETVNYFVVKAGMNTPSTSTTTPSRATWKTWASGTPVISATRAFPTFRPTRSRPNPAPGF